MEKNGECSKWKDCKSFKRLGDCYGCGFQHFDRLTKSAKINDKLEFLREEYFKLCSEKRQKRGQRIPMDEPIKKLLKGEIPELKEVDTKDLKISVRLPNGEKLELPIKCDGAFCLEKTGMYIFLEIKGYGTDTNSILSAITQFQLLKMDRKYKNSICIYIGGAKSTDRLKNLPYVKWAEANGILRFYASIDVEKMINDLKQYVTHF